jgi:hypothetical protein
MAKYLLSVHSVEGEAREPMTEEEMGRFMERVGVLEEEMKCASNGAHRMRPGHEPSPTMACRRSASRGTGAEAGRAVACSERHTAQLAVLLRSTTRQPSASVRAPATAGPHAFRARYVLARPANISKKAEILGEKPSGQGNLSRCTYRWIRRSCSVGHAMSNDHKRRQIDVALTQQEPLQLVRHETS